MRTQGRAKCYKARAASKTTKAVERGERDGKGKTLQRAHEYPTRAERASHGRKCGWVASTCGICGGNFRHNRLHPTPTHLPFNPRISITGKRSSASESVRLRRTGKRDVKTEPNARIDRATLQDVPRHTRRSNVATSRLTEDQTNDGCFGQVAKHTPAASADTFFRTTCLAGDMVGDWA